MEKDFALLKCSLHINFKNSSFGSLQSQKQFVSGITAKTPFRNFIFKSDHCEPSAKMDNGGISPKLYLSYIYDWALLFGLYSILQECFHQQTPEPVPPGPSHRHRVAPSRNVIQYLCILRIRKKCVIENHDYRHKWHRNMSSHKRFYGTESTYWGCTSVCKLTTHLWPSFKPYVREISTSEEKLIHTADTDIHLFETLPSAVQKQQLIGDKNKLDFAKHETIIMLSHTFNLILTCIQKYQSFIYTNSSNSFMHQTRQKIMQALQFLQW